MLSNSIALIAVAVLLGVEAWKASGGIARVVLTLLAVAFALSGVLLKWLTDTVPRLGQIVADTFSQPAAWFVLLMGLFFVVRQFWAPKPLPAVVPAHDPSVDLAESAYRIARFIGQYRSTRPHLRDRLPVLGPIIQEGSATIISFGKAGFAVPRLNSTQGENVAVGIQHYLGSMAPLLSKGHSDVAMQYAGEIARVATNTCDTLQADQWWTYRGW